MKTTMNVEGLLYINDEINNGTQRVFRFPNGRGASVVRHDYSYGSQEGLWELAVIEWDGKGDTAVNWEIDYDTPITDDVLGHLSLAQVNELLEEIMALPELTAKVKPEKVLWLSRHAMTEEQREELIQRRRSVSWRAATTPMHEIVHLNVTLPAYGHAAVRAILDLCEEHKADVVAGVLPAHVAACWMLRGIEDVTLYLPVSAPAPAVEGETRGGGFVFSHWEAY